MIINLPVFRHCGPQHEVIPTLKNTDSLAQAKQGSWYQDTCWIVKCKYIQKFKININANIFRHRQAKVFNVYKQRERLNFCIILAYVQYLFSSLTWLSSLMQDTYQYCEAVRGGLSNCISGDISHAYQRQALCNTQIYIL